MVFLGGFGGGGGERKSRDNSIVWFFHELGRFFCCNKKKLHISFLYINIISEWVFSFLLSVFRCIYK